MSTHLTDAELKAFAEARLRLEDLMRADDHLAQCADCRARGAALDDFDGAIGVIQKAFTSGDRHLSDEEIQLAARGQLHPSERVALQAHLHACESCAQQVEDLRSWSAPTLRPVRRLAFAAAILLAVLIPVALWQARAARQTPERSLAGLAQLESSDQAEVRASLDAGIGRLPAFMDDLTGPRETLMSAPRPAADTFALVSPVATAVASDRPMFRWQPLTGAATYVVTVYDEQANEIARSAPLGEPAWLPDRPLPRERTYIWQVAAQRNTQTVVAPAAPTPPAKFHVVDAHTSAVIAEAQAQRPGSHLLLGILFMNAGIVPDAIRQFEQVGPTDPGSDLARRSLDRLRLVHGS